MCRTFGTSRHAKLELNTGQRPYDPLNRWFPESWVYLRHSRYDLARREVILQLVGEVTEP